MSITLQQADDMLQRWLNAEKAVATGQSYRIGSRSLERANLSEIRKQIDYWRAEVERLKTGRRRGPRFVRVIARDL